MQILVDGLKKKIDSNRQKKILDPWNKCCCIEWFWIESNEFEFAAMAFETHRTEVDDYIMRWFWANEATKNTKVQVEAFFPYKKNSSQQQIWQTDKLKEKIYKIQKKDNNRETESRRELNQKKKLS